MHKSEAKIMDSNTFENQLKRTFYAFRKDPKTMKMVEVETGIDRPNICRYVAFLEKRKKITVVKKDTCKITSHTAKYFSTDPTYFPKETQPELFPTERCRV
jgi:hypothetical protein